MSPVSFRAARTYRSPRQGPLDPESAVTRAVSYGLKAACPSAVATAGAALARLVPPGSILVPVPSTTRGTCAANHVLCEAICRAMPRPDRGAVVPAVLSTGRLPSQAARHRLGHPPHPVAALPFAADPSVRLGARGGPIILVDNVRTSGHTLAAAGRALQTVTDRPLAVVWADASGTLPSPVPSSPGSWPNGVRISPRESMVV